MKKNFLFLALILSIFACEDEPDSYYRFKITSTGNKFYGEYTVNGKEDFTIDATDVVTSGSYYIFEKNLSNPDSIHIKVDGFDSTNEGGQTSRISIEVYQDSELKKEVSTTASASDAHVYVTLYYEFIDDSEETDSESTDTDS